MAAAALPLAYRFRSAGLTLTVAKASFDIWWLYEGADSRSRLLPALNEYPEFFRRDSEAHWRVAIIGSCALFDRDPRAMSFPAFLKESASAGLDVCALKTDADGLAPKLVKIKLLRDKLFAHRDGGVIYDDAYMQAQLAADGVREVLDKSVTIHNQLSDLHGFQRMVFHSLASDHLAALLARIRPAPG